MHVICKENSTRYVLEKKGSSSQGTAFPTSLYVRPAETWVRLSIHAVWWVLWQGTVGRQSSIASSGGQRRLWSAFAGRVYNFVGNSVTRFKCLDYYLCRRHIPISYFSEVEQGKVTNFANITLLKNLLFPFYSKLRHSNTTQWSLFKNVS